MTSPCACKHMHMAAGRHLQQRGGRVPGTTAPVKRPNTNSDMPTLQWCKPHTPGLRMGQLIKGYKESTQLYSACWCSSMAAHMVIMMAAPHYTASGQTILTHKLSMVHSSLLHT